jgi:hypothetical protein
VPTIEELREFLDGDRAVLGNIQGKSRVRILDEVFGTWQEDPLGALLLDLGMILGTRRGEEGVQCLAHALKGLGALLAYHKQNELN